MTITEKYHACIMVELSTPFELQRLRDTEDGVVSGLLINKVLTPNQRALAETTWFLADQNLATNRRALRRLGQGRSESRLSGSGSNLQCLIRIEGRSP